MSEDKYTSMTDREIGAELDKIASAMIELPDAFARMEGTLADKIKAYREFASECITELRQSKAALPDSLNRPLPERIKLLLERADREAGIAVELRSRLNE